MIRTVILAALALVALASNADARPRYTSPSQGEVSCDAMRPCYGDGRSLYGEVSRVYEDSAIIRTRRAGSQKRRPMPPGLARVMAEGAGRVVSHPSGCPARAFCGCGAAVRIFGKPIRSLWLAANWFRFPRTSPAPGTVAVRRHHVFVLEQHVGGSTWIVFDANSGRHMTRVHPRSIAGYVIVDPRGA